MKDGYLTCACASFPVALADVNHNKNEILKIIEEVSKTDTRLLVFPELCLSGYSIEDLFQQQLVLDTCKSALKEIVEESKKYDLVMVIGMPLQVKNSLFNVAAVIKKGKVLVFLHIRNFMKDVVLFLHQKKINRLTFMEKKCLLVQNVYSLVKKTLTLLLELRFVKIYGFQIHQVFHWH